jgi:hypothetical protein
MWKESRKKGKMELDEIDMGFCYLHILVEINPCGFIEQLGEYQVVKLVAKFIDIKVQSQVCNNISKSIHSFGAKNHLEALLLNYQYDNHNEFRLERVLRNDCYTHRG